MLRRAVAYLSQASGTCRERLYPLVSELAVDAVPVAVSCRVPKLARQPYYRWLAEPITDTEWDEALLTNAVFDAHRDDPEFGYRFLDEEVRAAGLDVAERTVWDLLGQRLVVQFRQEERPERQEGRPTSPRRPGAAGLHH